MANFSVNTEALRAAAKQLEIDALNYENASKVAKAAADALAANWIGDSQKAFVSEQEKAFTWYSEMTAVARQYSAFLVRAAAEYEVADGESSSVINAR